MLNAYLAEVNNLIQAPSSPVPLITSTQLTIYINRARQQLAADAECVRMFGNLSTAIGVPSYLLSAVVPPVSSVFYPLSVYAIRSGLMPLDFRPWPWFVQYSIGNGQSGDPKTAAQQGQGTAGELWLNPIPIAVVLLQVDASWIPINLVDDTTVEAIPYPWTDAVPFYAAWLALLQLQRPGDADVMFARYKLLAVRGRQITTPSELPINLPGGLGAQRASTTTILSGDPKITAGGGR